MGRLPESCITVMPEDLWDLEYARYEAYVFTPGEGGDGRGVSGVPYERAVAQIRDWLDEGYTGVRLTGIQLPRDQRARHVLLDTRNGIDHLGLLGEPTMAVARPWLTPVRPGRRGRASSLAQRTVWTERRESLAA